MGYGYQVRKEFAKAYSRLGNATHALKTVLSESQLSRMKPHTIRARASELLNDYRTVEMIEEFKAEMAKQGELLPHYRGRTERTDLMSDRKDPPAKHDILTATELAGLNQKIRFSKWLKRR
ncbi:TPA: hypothetical protein QB006_001942 [Pasteurella multocida]|uniref:hypothetical protein n=1 Tax=Pasteurella multocida TaxID=747 RepID=UPI000233F74F|nr:hypothetical protein [Pasteurella multocida]AET16438.1 hypothetical protein Pmu_15600 [Pasteurella multocida 36950]AFI46735.1 hypothetical protein NT08PM_1619 [Pasteurella multocida subsp. multocida str. 3480]AHE64938.1 hypothetical protein PMCN03_1503 [Pasteurella multocida subsp. multocida str. HB03]AIN49670.1 hypothetical protein DR93_163 [Pasteurella multocida]AUK26914.1 hypothetical protein A4211_10060 [Pasteurella multocida]